MKLLVFGGGGRTGRDLIVQLLARGHKATALVRDARAFGLSYDRLRAVSCDALEPASFQAALEGQEAVLSVLGVTGFWASLRPMTFYRDSARAIVTGMRAAGVARLVLVSSIGVLDKPAAPAWYRALVKPLLRHKYADMRAMEAFVARSGLDWTIVRAARLIDGPLTQHYRVGAGGTLPDITTISRSDLADFLARAVADPAMAGQMYAISR
ncbi:NAD(P)-dependent oxidoreductase [Sphingomonas morindae]|uniref:SDR family oxidoreductase n=1 Tax=Sphingomonas morindae TaxID=1541170 RepID=A0ABY4XCF4_9SPHN|nr:NAD(P)-binding oxidoreductase [Sphingomonas morindae]USI74653.1 SDR family oxidoreductase [Sphingomonas morindae]